MTVFYVLIGIVLSVNVFPSFCQNLPCNLDFGVDLSDGEVFQNGSIAKDGIVYAKGNVVTNEEGVKVGCICNIKSCVRKCCPIGEFLNNKTCEPTNATFVIPDNIGPPLEFFHVVSGDTCPNNETRNLLHRGLSGRLGEFVLMKNGKLYLPQDGEYYSQTNYCLDYINNDEEVGKALICTVKKFAVSPTNVIGMIISMPFLLATFIVYALLPERNLYGKSLMFYVVSLFGAYLLIVYIQLYPTYFYDTRCIIVGIFCYFFFMVSFLFMNVMSIDIWWTFGNFRGASSNRKHGEQKRFLLYCMYALGVPLLFVIIITSFTLTLDADSTAWYNPGMASGQCWLSTGFPTLLYFYAPIAIIIATNIALFGITAIKINRVQKDAAVLKNESTKKSHESDKRRFNLYLKLSMAMGINWSLELISWTVNWQIGYMPQTVWYLTDFCNAIYGVFIFFIFVFKKNIWAQLKTRYQNIMGRSINNGIVTVVDFAPKKKVTTNNQDSSSNCTNETIIANGEV